MPPKPHIYTHYTTSSCTILQVYGHYGNIPFKRLALLGLYIIIGLMLLQWSREWHQMRFNVEKCKVCLMHFGHSNLENSYKMNGSYDCRQPETLSARLTQCTALSNAKANRRFGLFKRTVVS